MELIATSAAAREGMYLDNLLGEFFNQFGQYRSSHLTCNASFSGRTKHISKNYYVMRDSIDQGKASIHVPGTLQLSDLLKKHLSRPAFQRFRDMIQAYGLRRSRDIEKYVHKENNYDWIEERWNNNAWRLMKRGQDQQGYCNYQ